jgi:hypothetical protein
MESDDDDEEDSESGSSENESSPTLNDASTNTSRSIKRSKQTKRLDPSKDCLKTKDDDEAHFENARAKERELSLIAVNKEENEVAETKVFEKKILRLAHEHVLHGLLQQISVFQNKASKAVDQKKKKEFSDFAHTLKVWFDMDAEHQPDLDLCAKTKKIWSVVSAANELVRVLEELTEDRWNKAMKKIRLQKGRNKKFEYGRALIFLFKATLKKDKPEGPCCSRLELIKRVESVLPDCKLCFREMAESLLYPDSATDELAREDWKDVIFLKMSELDLLSELKKERTEDSSRELDKMLKNIDKELVIIREVCSMKDKSSKELSKYIHNRQRLAASIAEPEQQSRQIEEPTSRSEDPIKDENEEPIVTKHEEVHEPLLAKEKGLSGQVGQGAGVELGIVGDQEGVEQGIGGKLNHHLEEQDSRDGTEQGAGEELERCEEQGPVEHCEALEIEQDPPRECVAEDGNGAVEREGQDQKGETENQNNSQAIKLDETDLSFSNILTCIDGTLLKQVMALSQEQKVELQKQYDENRRAKEELTKNLRKERKEKNELELNFMKATEDLTKKLDKEKRANNELAKSLEKVKADSAEKLEKAGRDFAKTFEKEKTKNSEKVLAKELEKERKSKQELAKNLEKEKKHHAVTAANLETANEEIARMKALLRREGRAKQELVVSLKEKEREKSGLVNLLQKKDDSDGNWTKNVSKTSLKGSGETSFY